MKNTRIAHARSKILRTLRHTLPTVSSAAARAAQLLVLAAVSHLAPAELKDIALVAFVMLGSFTQLFDSGALAYLLVNERAALTRSAAVKVGIVHLGTVGVGLATAILLSIAVVGLRDPATIITVSALGLAQVIDGAARVLRAHQLIRGLPGQFAVPELISTAGRVLAVGASWVLGDFRLLTLVVLPAALTLWLSWHQLPHQRGSETVTVRVLDVLSFGFSGMTSTFLSQAPLLVVSLALPATLAAPLSVATRVTQAAEFLPATLAQQALPTIRRNAGNARRLALQFFAIGIITAAAIWLASPLISLLIAFPEGTSQLLSILLLALPFRFANHLVASICFAYGLVLPKAWLSLALGLVASATVFAATVLTTGVLPVAIIATTLEPLQLAAFAALLGLTRRRARGGPSTLARGRSPLSKTGDS